MQDAASGAGPDATKRRAFDRGKPGGRRKTGKKKRHGDRGAKKVLAIPRAVLEPERLRETSLPVKLLKRCFENVRHSFRFRPTSQAVFAPIHALSGNAQLSVFLINQG